MTDDLDDLKALFDQATPAPDADRKAANIDAAVKTFAAIQETTDAARPTLATGRKGLWQGVMGMIDVLTTRGGLAASTAIAAVGLLYLVPFGSQPMPEIPMPKVAVQPAATESSAAMADEAPVMRQLAAPAPEEAIVMSEPAPAPMPQATGLAAPAAKIAPPMDMEAEAFANADPNPLKVTAQEPVSTFSIDVDTASYATVRNMLNWGQLPTPEAVRIEEMVNYFPYDYAAPTDAPFAANVAVMPTPWNDGTRLLRIGIQAETPAERVPLDLVFLIDTSGSMEDANKLPLLKQSLGLLLGQLAPDDRIAIVAYAGSSGQVLEPTQASDRKAIMAALDNLSAGGGTNGQGGLEQAYDIAATMQTEGRVARVLLATDGDFNVGLSDPATLEDFIAKKADSGVYLSVLGFGRGNLDDATMQALAQNGNGTAAYIDTLSEAQKVLVDQMAGAMFPVADDVKIQIEFNPAQVAEYRLIGYETRALAREDFNNDAVDAGEIGAGHTVTALYEITAPDSPARLTDDLRYTAAPSGAGDEIGFLRIRYKEPGEDVSQLIETTIGDATVTDTDANFAAAVAGFGQLLTGSRYLGDWGYDDAIALATANKGDDPYGYRAEAVGLMRLAQSLSQ